MKRRDDVFGLSRRFLAYFFLACARPYRLEPGSFYDQKQSSGRREKREKKILERKEKNRGNIIQERKEKNGGNSICSEKRLLNLIQEEKNKKNSLTKKLLIYCQCHKHFRFSTNGIPS